MYLDIDKEVSKVTDPELAYRLFYSDETSQELRELPSRNMYTLLDETKYTTLHLSGKVNQINMNIDGQKGAILTIAGIELNKPIPFEFQFVRFFILLGIGYGIYALVYAKIMEEKLNFKSKDQWLVIFIVGAVTCLIFSLFLINGVGKDFYFTVDQEKYGVYHNYIYDVEYTKALANGSLALQIDVDEKLLELENPYDETARNAVGFQQIYDYAYYDGAYYVYFSILPQLILVPFHLITGLFLNSQWLILLFMLFGVMSSIKLLKQVFKTWFPETKFRNLVLAILLLLFASSLLYTVATPGIYELVAVLGYWLVTGGIYRIWSALEDFEKIRFGKLSIRSINACL